MSTASEIRNAITHIFPTRKASPELKRIRHLLNAMSDKSINAWTVKIQTEHLTMSEEKYGEQTTAQMLFNLLKFGAWVREHDRNWKSDKSRMEVRDAYSDLVISTVLKSLEEFYRTLPIK